MEIPVAVTRFTSLFNVDLGQIPNELERGLLAPFVAATVRRHSQGAEQDRIEIEALLSKPPGSDTQAQQALAKLRAMRETHRQHVLLHQEMFEVLGALGFKTDALVGVNDADISLAELGSTKAPPS